MTDGSVAARPATAPEAASGVGPPEDETAAVTAVPDPVFDPVVRHSVVRGRLRFALTGRAGGVSPAPWATANLGAGVGDDPRRVSANRAALTAALGLSPGALRFATQVHGTRVLSVDGPWPVPGPEADALLVTAPGLAAGVLGADCMPLLLGDPERGVAAAVHVGRAGLAAGVVPAALAALAAAGARRLVASCGPTICGRCYEVPPRLQASVAAAVPEAVSTTSWGTASLDLLAGVRSQLAAAAGAGLVVAVDESWAQCTLESEELFSHRRQAPTGRHAGVVAVLP